MTRRALLGAMVALFVVGEVPVVAARVVVSTATEIFSAYAPEFVYPVPYEGYCSVYPEDLRCIFSR